MAVPNASQIRFLESKLNSKRELRLLQTDFQGRAGINCGPVQDFKVRPRVCLDPSKLSQNPNFLSHLHHIETLNIANDPCMEY